MLVFPSIKHVVLVALYLWCHELVWFVNTTPVQQIKLAVMAQAPLYLRNIGTGYKTDDQQGSINQVVCTGVKMPPVTQGMVLFVADDKQQRRRNKLGSLYWGENASRDKMKGTFCAQCPSGIEYEPHLLYRLASGILRVDPPYKEYLQPSRLAHDLL